MTLIKTFLTSIDSRYISNAVSPADHGLISWDYDPAFASTSQTVTNGTVYLCSIRLQSAVSISKLWFNITAAASGVTAGQNWAGLYNSSGTLVASAATDSAITSGSNVYSVTLSSAYSASAGRYWVALLFNATTPPSMLRTNGNTQAVNNATQSAASYRFAINGTGQTTLPSSITPSSNNPGTSFWAGVS